MESISQGEIVGWGWEAAPNSPLLPLLWAFCLEESVDLTLSRKELKNFPVCLQILITNFCACRGGGGLSLGEARAFSSPILAPELSDLSSCVHKIPRNKTFHCFRAPVTYFFQSHLVFISPKTSQSGVSLSTRLLSVWCVLIPLLTSH